MFNLFAMAVLASTSIVPCATIADQSADHIAVHENILETRFVDEALTGAEESFAAHVQELGLAGAAPLFGTQPDPTGEAVRSARRPESAVSAKSRRLSVSRTPRR